MSNKELYTLVVPANAQTVSRSEIKRNLATHGLLGDSSAAAVESLSLEPGQQVLTGQFRGKYADLMAQEIEELFDAAAVSSVVFFDPAGSKEDAYYSLKNIDVGPADPNTGLVQQFDGVLTKEGTRESKRRRVVTKDRQVENDFGNDQTTYVGVPAAASDVQWYDRQTGATEPVSVVDTRTAEHGDIDITDAKASSYTAPGLVYDLPYDEEGKVDVVVWDDHNRAKLDADGVNSWQWVFSTSHTFAGSCVVDNGLVRVRFDGGALAVEEWDATAESWASVALGTSDWTVEQADVTRIGPERVDAQCRFANSSTGDQYHLDMSVKRGYWWPQWTVPEGEQAPTPSGLQDLLAPVANGSDYSPQSEQGLVDRQEVRA